VNKIKIFKKIDLFLLRAATTATGEEAKKR